MSAKKTKKIMALLNIIILVLLTISSCTETSSAFNPNLPVIIPQSVSNEESGACPASDSLRETVSDEIAAVLEDISHPTCRCSLGYWTNIATFNYSNPDVDCPYNFTLTTEPVRGCSRAPGEAATCKSVNFSTGGQSYTRVCGRVNAYQKGSTDAFHVSRGPRTLEEIYVDGVSLTHGAPGSRQHIWTFAAALHEGGPFENSKWTCPCANTTYEWPFEIYSYIGDNYFCATGFDFEFGRIEGTDISFDTLWDGEGCGESSDCCEFNTPPWFCTSLPEATTDDIELRVCNNEDETNEDVILSFVELNILV